MKPLPVRIEERDVIEAAPEEAVTPSCGSIHNELRGKVRISVEGYADPAAVVQCLKTCDRDRPSREGASTRRPNHALRGRAPGRNSAEMNDLLFRAVVE